MTLIALLFLSISLAMDCFSVSLASGVAQRRLTLGNILKMAVFFGFFQGAMPFLGWLAAASFSDLMKDYDHWIAFGLLSFLGIKMILECFKDEGEKSFDPSKLSVLLTLSVATSIDALAVGLTFAFISMSVADVFIASGIIAAGSFLFTFAGNFLGSYVRKKFKFPFEAVGGVALICIGLKILFEHIGII